MQVVEGQLSLAGRLAWLGGGGEKAPTIICAKRTLSQEDRKQVGAGLTIVFPG